MQHAFAVLVGLHNLSFFKAVCKLGTVPTAVSKGVQQAGNFVFAHLLFCSTDPTECLWNNGKGKQTTWNHWQKACAFLFCCTGVVLCARLRCTPRQPVPTRWRRQARAHTHTPCPPQLWPSRCVCVWPRLALRDGAGADADVVCRLFFAAAKTMENLWKTKEK